MEAGFTWSPTDQVRRKRTWPPLGPQSPCLQPLSSPCLSVAVLIFDLHIPHFYQPSVLVGSPGDIGSCAQHCQGLDFGTHDLEGLGGGTHRSKSSHRDDPEMLVACSPCSLSTLGHSPHTSEAGQAELVSLLLASSVMEALVFHGSFSTGLELGLHPTSRGRGSGVPRPSSVGGTGFTFQPSTAKSRPMLSFCLSSLWPQLEGALSWPLHSNHTVQNQAL